MPLFQANPSVELLHQSWYLGLGIGSRGGRRGVLDSVDEESEVPAESLPSCSGL